MPDDEREYAVTVDGRELAVRLLGTHDHCQVSVNGATFQVDLFSSGAVHQFSLLINHQSFEGVAEQTEDGWRVWLDSEPFDLQVVDARLRGLGRGPGAVVGAQMATMTTPMPGMIVSVVVAPGDEVTKGQPLLTLEAMKMRNDLKSPRGGRVREVKVAPGETVARGDVLLVFET